MFDLVDVAFIVFEDEFLLILLGLRFLLLLLFHDDLLGGDILLSLVDGCLVEGLALGVGEGSGGLP